VGDINTYRLVLRTLKVTDRIENLIEDGRVVLKWIAVYWIYFAQLVGPIEICFKNAK
jgi:hypothetical protein